MSGRYRSGQISTFRNLPARTKHQIKYASLHLGVTRGALIAAALDEYLRRLAEEKRLPEDVTNLILLEGEAQSEAILRGQPVEAENHDGRCNTPQSTSSSSQRKNALNTYMEMLDDADTSSPTREDLEFAARMAERRARRDALMGRSDPTP